MIEGDIRIFLHSRFSDIHDERELSSDWPGEAAIIQLTAMAAPLFIFAATICRYIGQQNLDPRARLKRVLLDAAQYSTKMDKTYLPILHQLLPDQTDDDDRKELFHQFHTIIGVIILLETPLSIAALARLVKLEQSSVTAHLNNFQYVLYIPESRAPVRILHLSFRDFLLQTDSSFHVDSTATNRRITSNCLDLMNDSLKRNICELPSYGTERETIDKEVIKQYVPEDLQYSCRYWAQHLVRSNPSTALVSSVFSFLKKHFLHWLEAMNILCFGPETMEIINMLQPIMQVSFLY